MTAPFRKLVTIRKIDEIRPIEGADAIVTAVIGGWTIVVKKGEFVPGDNVFYFEIDSFLPEGVPAWQFLVDKQGREFEGVRGHRLRTVKLRGQISQGFVLSLDTFPALRDKVMALADNSYDAIDKANAELDLAAELDIKKWEATLPAELAGQAAGLFPSFIQKTDQERCQNLVSEIFGFDEQRVLIDGLAPEQADQGAILGGRIVVEDGKVYSVRAAKADRNAKYEVTLKLDGSSMTGFIRKTETGEVVRGVCSRNLELKINDENKDNTFVKIFNEGLSDALFQFYMSTGRSIAVQGELMGPGIQGNRENFKEHKFFVFDIYDIDRGEYLAPRERQEVFAQLKVAAPKIEHVPVVAAEANLLDTLGISDVKQLLAFADGPSITNPVREGLVFKRLDGKFSFKAISNVYLAKEKD